MELKKIIFAIAMVIASGDFTEGSEVTPIKRCDLPLTNDYFRGSERWYFNKARGRCALFYYSSFRQLPERTNNFPTEKECVETCIGEEPNVCQLPKKRGTCKANMPRYYYNKNTGKCVRFRYGGCEGNGNNFETELDCQMRCVNICDLPAERGNCSGDVIRFYHNKNTKKCERFTYGGCGGNANNFERLERCENHCIHPCWQPKRWGLCHPMIPRFFYNVTSSKCEYFFWSLCHGNSNRFMNESACQELCHEVCEQPKKPGPCSADIERYYYNKVTRQCERFKYGGCEANGNNFFTEQECEDACEPRGIYY